MAIYYLFYGLFDRTTDLEDRIVSFIKRLFTVAKVTRTFLVDKAICYLACLMFVILPFLKTLITEMAKGFMLLLIGIYFGILIPCIEDVKVCCLLLSKKVRSSNSLRIASEHIAEFIAMSAMASWLMWAIQKPISEAREAALYLEKRKSA